MANVQADEQAINDENENMLTKFMSTLGELVNLPDNVWRSRMDTLFHEIIGEDFYRRYYLYHRQWNADLKIQIQKFQYLKEWFNKLGVISKSALKNEAHLLRANIRHAEICLKGTKDRNNFLSGMINETRKNLENVEKEVNAKVESKKVEKENARSEVEDAKKAVEAKETNPSGREAKEDKGKMEGKKEPSVCRSDAKEDKKETEVVKESIASRIKTSGRTRKCPEGSKEAMEGTKESSASGNSTGKRTKWQSLNKM